jgi:rare lipoprotein A (peptidoglycan hydrolase)
MRHPILLCLIVICALLSLVPELGSATRQPQAGPPAPKREIGQVGAASYYHSFFDGRKTASGATFSSGLLTAASRTLDFGTRVRVTNLVNLKSVVVTINDRGPYVDGRIIDLSRRAASVLGFIRDGVTRVRVEPITVASAL